MLTPIPQIEPVSRLQREWRLLVDKLGNGPIILSNQGKAAAVLLSTTDYDHLVGRLAELEKKVTQ